MNTVLSKMQIKAPHLLLLINAPENFAKSLGRLPAGIAISFSTKALFDSVHWFVKCKKEVDQQVSEVLNLLKPGIALWCYFPKGTSGIQTDLTRDKGWEMLLEAKNLKWINLVSFDDTWSAFSFRLRSEAEGKKDTKPTDREIWKYADSATKTIRLPDDVSVALTNNKVAESFFNALAFSHRREYLEWILTAKKQETREIRISRMIVLLEANQKVR